MENREENYNDKGSALRWSKGKVELQRVAPQLVEEVAKVLQISSEKYPDNEDGTANWMGGLSYQSLIGCMERHLNEFKKGVDKDKDTGCHTLAHLACNIMFVLYFESTGKNKELDNRCFKPR